MEQLAANKCFGGVITKYKATSSSLGGLATQFKYVAVFSPGLRAWRPCGGDTETLTFARCLQCVPA